MDSDWLFLLVLGWLFQADSNTEKYLRLTAESYDRIIDALAPLYNDMFKGGDEDE